MPTHPYFDLQQGNVESDCMMVPKRRCNACAGIRAPRRPYSAERQRGAIGIRKRKHCGLFDVPTQRRLAGGLRFDSFVISKAV